MDTQYRLAEVSPKEVRFSKQNPRGERAEAIRADKTFEQLKDSVAHFGVLVPIVVHRQRGDDGKKYTLVDGERRLRAALATGRESIAAHIADAEDRMSEFVQAFHIHMLRKQWKPIAQARAIRRMKRELRQKGDLRSDEELLEELQAQTGCTDTQIKRLSRVIRYPETTLRDVDAGSIRFSHLVQFEESFVEQLEEHYPMLLERLGKKQVRDVLVKKARRKVIDNTRALMENVVPAIARAQNKEEKKFLESLLEKFVVEPDMTPEEVKKHFEGRYPPSQDILELADEALEKAELLERVLKQIDLRELISFRKQARDLSNSLTALKKIIAVMQRQFGKFLRE